MSMMIITIIITIIQAYIPGDKNRDEMNERITYISQTTN